MTWMFSRCPRPCPCRPHQDNSPYPHACAFSASPAHVAQLPVVRRAVDTLLRLCWLGRLHESWVRRGCQDSPGCLPPKPWTSGLSMSTVFPGWSATYPGHVFLFVIIDCSFACPCCAMHLPRCNSSHRFRRAATSPSTHKAPSIPMAVQRPLACLHSTSWFHVRVYRSRYHGLGSHTVDHLQLPIAVAPILHRPPAKLSPLSL
jgi:hypothetical protein